MKNSGRSAALESGDMMHDARSRTQKGLTSRRRVLPGLLSLVALALLISPVHGGTWNVKAVLTDHLREQYPWAEIEVADVVLDGEAPQAPPQKILVDRRPPGKTVFSLFFPGNRKLTATTVVKAYDRVVMGARGFDRGYTLHEGDVYEALMDVTRIPRNALRDSRQALGKPLARSILANIPIQEGMVEDSPLVKRGRRVEIILESPGFAIRGTGELQQNSSVGEYVKVMNTVSKKIVTGLLVDERTVRVEF